MKKDSYKKLPVQMEEQLGVSVSVLVTVRIVLAKLLSCVTCPVVYEVY